ncbi:MAG: protein-L-isoaspartate(D-aspartate) O-methyltransferase [Campylobacterales bacterium]|nr:protein-L-isoaspartate(D-aspartate) O-methyltransferase [Campylobacterales bacterium]
MKTNQQLIDHLIQAGVLSSPLVIDAFRVCDRRLFVPERLSAEAYENYPLSIGAGQTISQPYTVALMLELLHPLKGQKILDIGSGSGWTTALLASIVGQEGFVEGLERIPSLVEYGRMSLKKMGITNASIAMADHSMVGKPGSLYDRILVSASATHLPKALLEQLNSEGILVIPIGESIWRIQKNKKGEYERSELHGFRFVPLITPQIP